MSEAQEFARPAAPVWTVSSLLLAVGDALGARFGALTVRGELSGFSRAASGHCYFQLKDESGAAAGVRCVMFRRHAYLLDFLPAEGQRVELRGRLAVYEARGELQVVAESLRRMGAGSLYEEFLRLRARLEALGLFDAAKKRLLPAFPSRIGVVTSPSGAALHDVIATFKRRAPHLPLIVYPSLVQGAEAPAAIAAALALANQRDEVELLILCRGGGSLEDLWAFNDERVVRAVAESRLPMICGVGHETDVTLAELAADLRAPTPTAAAELAAPSAAALRQGLEALEQRLGQRLRLRLDGCGQRLDQLALRLQRPARSVAGQAARVQALGERMRRSLHAEVALRRQRSEDAARRLQRALPVALAAHIQHVEAAAARLRLLDPRQVLNRGYAWVETAEGCPVTSVRMLEPGQRVRAVWADGSADARIEKVLPTPESGVVP